MRFGVALGAALGVLVLVGCGADGSAPHGPRPLPEGASEPYREAVADGVATEDEYTAGYRRFIACLAEAGYEVIELGRPSTLYEALVPDEAVVSGADQFCYETEWAEISSLWQAANPPTTSATPLLQACLEDAGLPTEGNEEELKQRIIDHGLDVLECLGL